MITDHSRLDSHNDSDAGFPDGSALLLREIEFAGHESDVVVDQFGAELVPLREGISGWVIERAFGSQDEAREFLESLPTSIADPASLGFRPLKAK